MKSTFSMIVILAIAACSMGTGFAKGKRIPPQVIDEEDYMLNVPATDKSHFPAALDPLELKRLRAFQVIDVVYVRGSTVQFKMKWYNPVPRSDSGTLQIIDFAFLEDNGTLTHLTINGGSSNWTEPVSIPSMGTYSSSTLTITGLPNYVTKGKFSFGAWISSPTGLNGGGFRSELAYLTDYTPCDTQALPWIDVLKFACDWADKKSTIYPVVKACTKGLNTSGLFTFPATDFSDRWIDVPTQKFNLTNCLNTVTTRFGNSRDVSSFLAIASNALGEPVGLAVLNSSPWKRNQEGFVTNSVLPVGSGTWRRIYLGSHQILVLYDPTLTFLYAYDSTFAQSLDLSGVAYNQAPAEWPLSGYWQTANPFAPPTYVGLVSRYGYPTVLPPDVRNITTNTVQPSIADEPVNLAAPTSGVLNGVL